MSLELSLDLRPSHFLHMTPELQQAILFLQLNSQELLEKIQEIAERNPLLDADIPHPEEVKLNKQELDESQMQGIEKQLSADYSPVKNSTLLDKDYDALLENYSTEENLHEHLHWQLTFEHLSEKEILIAEIIIDAIDEDGYLRQSIDDIQETVRLNSFEVDQKEIESVLNLIHHFEPLGVGARDLRECLLIQLYELPKETPDLDIAITLVKDYFYELSKHHYNQLQKDLHLSYEQLQHALHIIQTLNPEPGKAYLPTKVDYQIPDLLIEKDEHGWKAILNSAVMPKLSIHEQYRDWLKNNMEKNADFLHKNLQEAQWVIKSVERRHESLTSVAQYIVDKQTEFLEKGLKYLKPMILHEIADALHIHDSTVSRLTTNKFIDTPQGLFELKYFFSSHVKKTTSNQEVSSKAIKALLKEWIMHEDAHKPLSDGALTKKLMEMGISIARRTVAKYRESMHIPTCDQRKKL